MATLVVFREVPESQPCFVTDKRIGENKGADKENEVRHIFL